ncbi:hypothetical protein M011DRAFT_412953 [Sporormia fimetaria CBS 119925]|uniref:Uncharacterized protein n=1 Tax=Sporormia fimetaria CBS 119925 TaxID=1340428 RepID=A0A6A6UYV3_9PLEO|nr:hypothetical protein M011DRAFT_412953 [Sporormia fimetaria CBS 119925]
MFASFLQGPKPRTSERTPLLAALSRLPDRDHGAPDHDREAEADTARYDGEDEEDEEDGPRFRDGSLLPVFSELLDKLPIYATTHAIRLLVTQRCETTLCWDQLRSPQVSQFLVKPILQRILTDHFSRGTIYCLVVNCLQFRKEGVDNPGNVGISNTRALICELLAMRLLKEFSTRELIDALSYDFDPLQGMAMPTAAGAASPGNSWNRGTPSSARVSALEAAIRAQAKKFLAHPVVVQQLEAIWAGTIVFQSASDNMHRVPHPAHDRRMQRYGLGNPNFDRRPNTHNSQRRTTPTSTPVRSIVRRTVTLYDPHEASLFKLSRLRVPRYRSLFSTMSFAVMLGLFLAVLIQKSDDITALEVLFWFWSAGYMLDEIVGWSEQGFGLYIMSVWNAFDLGILFMYFVYYVLRIYGILITDTERHSTAGMAYDVLGATAVLLFPRLFSALDHVRYFSQLLIAFRMMALDLVAVLVLIIICCSGFLVAFTLAFERQFAANSAAYILFQMVMGYTPAVWDNWAGYNPLGKALLALFLFICHFLIVTILITVLTNSFMAVVQNANEEHQFLFAVNTISMVKSDALFAYIAPTNIIGWLVIPFKFCMPFRSFIRFNRIIIKITHTPILFAIFLYERLWLCNFSYEPAELVEQRGRSQVKGAMPAVFGVPGITDLFSANARLREPSITTFRKDQALEEVFRRPYQNTSVQASTHNATARRNSSNLIANWMKGMNRHGVTAPPQEDARSVLDRLEGRPTLRRAKTAGYVQRKRKPTSIAIRTSDGGGGELASTRNRSIVEENVPDISLQEQAQQTDADGDDELVSQSEEDAKLSDTTWRIGQEVQTKEPPRPQAPPDSTDEEYFRPTTAIRQRSSAITSSPESPRGGQRVSPAKKVVRPKSSHTRHWSTSTVLFSPEKDDISSASSLAHRPQTAARVSEVITGRAPADGRRTPKMPPSVEAKSKRPQPDPPLKVTNSTRPTSNIAKFLSQDRNRGEPSFNAVALDLASDLGDNRHIPDYGALGGVPASFTTEFEKATRSKKLVGSDDESGRMGRIMLARMTTLEEGFRDMLKEVKGLKKGSEDGHLSRDGSGRLGAQTSQPEQTSRKRVKARKRGFRAGKDEERIGTSL